VSPTTSNSFAAAKHLVLTQHTPETWCIKPTAYIHAFHWPGYSGLTISVSTSSPESCPLFLSTTAPQGLLAPTSASFCHPYALWDWWPCCWWATLVRRQGGHHRWKLILHLVGKQRFRPPAPSIIHLFSAHAWNYESGSSDNLLSNVAARSVTRCPLMLAHDSSLLLGQGVTLTFLKGPWWNPCSCCPCRASCKFGFNRGRWPLVFCLALCSWCGVGRSDHLMAQGAFLTSQYDSGCPHSRACGQGLVESRPCSAL
jgi:hypothetical protein